MAIVDDIKKDRRTRNVLAQTNTKTVSVPPASTGLVGDQQPAEVFTVADFDLVKNQVHLQEENFQLMEALNTMGQLTSMQSQSGPIPGTMTIATATAAASGNQAVVFRPDAGQVWRLVDLAVQWSGNSGTITASPVLTDEDGNDIFVGRDTSTAGHQEFPTIPQASLNITRDVFLKGWSSGTFSSGVWRAAVIRVR